MQHKRNNKLITNVLIAGVIIAILSYLFHPGVGQFSIMLNGEPVADPLVRFAAIPTLLIIMAITGFLITLLFFGIGVFMFLGAMFVGLAFIAIMAPYFWPVLVIIFLIISLMTVSHNDKN
jgi:hypothetical protein